MGTTALTLGGSDDRREKLEGVTGFLRLQGRDLTPERRNRELCPRGVIEAHVLPTFAPTGAPGPRQLRSREPAGSDLQQNQVKGVVAKLLAVWGDNELLKAHTQTIEVRTRSYSTVSALSKLMISGRTRDEHLMFSKREYPHLNSRFVIPRFRLQLCQWKRNLP